MQAGPEVVVPNTVHFRGRDGIEVIAKNGLVFTVENGQITCLRLFQEREEALEAAEAAATGAAATLRRLWRSLRRSETGLPE
jgi:hypothetical protein